jgi:hypothetical protein
VLAGAVAVVDGEPSATVAVGVALPVVEPPVFVHAERRMKVVNEAISRFLMR